MPTKQFAIERGGEKRITAEYAASWEDLTVSVDGEEVLRSKLMSQLMVGVEGALSDGRVMRAWLVDGGLALTIDGVPVPGSKADGYVRLEPAWIVMFVGAAVTALLGAIPLLSPSRPGTSMAVPWTQVLSGVLLATLAHFVRVKQSKLALGIGVGFYAAGAVFLVVTGLAAERFPFLPILVRGLGLAIMHRGFAAIDMIRAQRRAA